MIKERRKEKPQVSYSGKVQCWLVEDLTGRGSEKVHFEVGDRNGSDKDNYSPITVCKIRS
jgi:hypothetical protein